MKQENNSKLCGVLAKLAVKVAENSIGTTCRGFWYQPKAPISLQKKY